MQPTEPALHRLTTEQPNPATARIDTLPTIDVLRLMNAEDRRVPEAVGQELPAIAEAVDGIAARLAGGGRLFYVGAGTSGRLAILDAAECPPTFSTPPSLVQALIAGGPSAMTQSVEGAEDDAAGGVRDLRDAGVTARDAVVGLSASGRAPYVLGALDAGRATGALTIGICCVAGSAMVGRCDVLIAPVVGPEVLTGSTRLKAGTAQKLVLNMLSTATMIRLGKCYGNLMVDLRASNAKLRDRAARIVSSVAGTEYAVAWQTLEDAGFETKLAIVMLRLGLGKEEAERRLADADGHLRAALGE